MEELKKKKPGAGSTSSRNSWSSSSSLHLLYAYGFWTQIPILRVVPREETQGESQILVNLWGFFTKEKNESWSHISRKYVPVLAVVILSTGEGLSTLCLSIGWNSLRYFCKFYQCLATFDISNKYSQRSSSGSLLPHLQFSLYFWFKNISQ